MKPTLLLLSDLWGHRRPLPYSAYKKQLGERFELRIFDSTQLAGISPDISEQEDLHQAFLQGGIDRAVDQLTQLAPQAQYLIGCSIGGVIAWQYALRHAHVRQLVALSTTRLRHETSKPNGQLHLYYGALDPYQPKADWYEQLGLSAQKISGRGHGIYRQENLVPTFCDAFL